MASLFDRELSSIERGALQAEIDSRGKILELQEQRIEAMERQRNIVHERFTRCLVSMGAAIVVLTVLVAYIVVRR